MAMDETRMVIRSATKDDREKTIPQLWSDRKEYGTNKIHENIPSNAKKASVAKVSLLGLTLPITAPEREKLEVSYWSQ